MIARRLAHLAATVFATMFLAGGGWSLSSPALAQVALQIVVPCRPSSSVEEAASAQGIASKLIGAFDDGDLLVVYRHADGRFVMAFARPDGLTCMLGNGSGLEERPHDAPGKGS